MNQLHRAALITGLFGASALLAIPGLYSFYAPTQRSTEALRAEVQNAIATRQQPRLIMGEKQRLPLADLYLLLSVTSGLAGLGVSARSLFTKVVELPNEPQPRLLPASQPVAVESHHYEPQPPVRELTPQQKNLTQLLDLTQGGKKVDFVRHLMIEGSTGDGKTTFTSYLPNIFTGSWIVIDPHYSPLNWAGLPVVGGGQDYATIALVLEAVLGLMRKRYQLLLRGLPVGGIVNVVLDEFPAIKASDECKDIAPEALGKLSREARKVGIRLILLTQGSNVKELGIEGEGNIRKNFLHIQCGATAKEYAEGLKDKTLFNQIESLDYVYLLNNKILPVPDLSVLPTDYQTEMLPDELQRFIDHKNSSTKAQLERLYSIPTETVQAEKVELTTEQSALYAYALKKGKPLSPRDIKQATVKGLEGCSTDNIREIIESLASLGHGTWDGETYST